MNRLQKYIVKDKYGYDKEYINPKAKNKREITIAASAYSFKIPWQAYYHNNPAKIISRGRTAEGLMRRLARKGYGNIRIMD